MTLKHLNIFYKGLSRPTFIRNKSGVKYHPLVFMRASLTFQRLVWNSLLTGIFWGWGGTEQPKPLKETLWLYCHYLSLPCKLWVVQMDWQMQSVYKEEKGASPLVSIRSLKFAEASIQSVWTCFKIIRRTEICLYSRTSAAHQKLTLLCNVNSIRIFCSLSSWLLLYCKAVSQTLKCPCYSLLSSSVHFVAFCLNFLNSAIFLHRFWYHSMEENPCPLCSTFMISKRYPKPHKAHNYG